MKFFKGILLIILITGCAMITKGPVQELEFTSNTDSVNVYVNGKDIGYTPTSVKLWKIKKNSASFYMPDGQEHDYQLKTHLNSAILNNGLLVLLNPILGGIGFGVDWFVGSGRSFDERTFRFKNDEIEKIIIINITAKNEEPETYILISGGMGIGFITANNKTKTNYFPDLFIEGFRSYRDRYHLGFGINLQGKRTIDEDDEFTIYQYYLAFKFSPFSRNEKMRLYFALHAGSGWSWGKYMGSSRWGPSLFYGATGIGFEYMKKIYIEILGRHSFMVAALSERMGCSSFSFRIGYRFDLF